MITAADIRAARARLKEPQEQFASRLGISRGTLIQWEKSAPDDRAKQMLLAQIMNEIDSYMQEPVK